MNPPLARIRRSRFGRLAVAMTCGIALVVMAPQAAVARQLVDGSGQVTAWSAAPQPPLSTTGLTSRTVRQVVQISATGTAVRLVLSNLYGNRPIHFSAAVARSAAGAAVVPGTSQAVTFAGAASVTIPAGGSATSDSALLSVTTGTNVSVSLYVDGDSGQVTRHYRAFNPGWVSAPGNFVSASDASAFSTSISRRLWLTGMQVEGSSDVGTVVALGDSITDGVGSSDNTNQRWPDLLAARLTGAGIPLSVANAGIGGNRLLRGTLQHGASALDRLDRDVLGQAGVRDVIVFEGINDIGHGATAAQLIQGYEQIAGRLHAANVRAVAATLPPFRGFGYYTPDKEAIRAEVNQWLRSSGVFDGVVDFGAALASPTDPTVLRAEFDAGDHLHPNDRGYQALADAVDLALLS